MIAISHLGKGVVLAVTDPGSTTSTPTAARCAIRRLRGRTDLAAGPFTSRSRAFLLMVYAETSNLRRFSSRKTTFEESSGGQDQEKCSNR